MLSTSKKKYNFNYYSIYLERFWDRSFVKERFEQDKQTVIEKKDLDKRIKKERS